MRQSALVEQLQPAIAPQHTHDLLGALVASGLLAVRTAEAPPAGLFAQARASVRCLFPSPAAYSLLAAAKQAAQ